MTNKPTPAVKKFLYITRRAPHGTNYAQEGLEVALIGAAFDQEVAIACVDDGVFQLKAGQDTAAAGVKNFSAAYRALGDYEVRRVYVEKESLADRGLEPGDLMELVYACLLYTSPSPRDATLSRMPSSA